jgi:hypothetical protein
MKLDGEESSVSKDGNQITSKHVYTPEKNLVETHSVFANGTTQYIRRVIEDKVLHVTNTMTTKDAVHNAEVYYNRV